MKENIKKFLLSAVAVMLVMALSVAGTLAYLQDESNPVENKFTTNKVTVELNETTEPNYSIIPGTEQKKDPKVTVDASIAAYVYLVVNDTTNGAVTYEIDDTVWSPLETDANAKVPNVYYAEVDGTAKKVLNVLKDEKVSYAASLTNDDMPTGNATLSFKAFAIQKVNGTDAEGVNTTFSAFQGYSQVVLGISNVVAPADANGLETVLAGTRGTGEDANKPVAIVLTQDVSGIRGLQVGGGTNTPTVKADFSGKTATVSTSVGSQSTETCGMQLMKGSTIELTNGTYNADQSSSVALLVQNYCDLTLKDFTLDGTTKSGINYVLSSNCGNVLITGNSNIIAAEGATAIDVMYWYGSYNEGTTVTIDENMTGVVDGKIDLYGYGYPGYMYANITAGGVHYGNYTDSTTNAGATLIIKGGTFKNTGLTLEQFSTYVPTGYTATEIETGVYKVTKTA